MAENGSPQYREFGENVRYLVEGDELTIKVDLSHRGCLSATEKTRRVATTHGNKALPDLPIEIFISVNAYVYAKEREPGSETAFRVPGT